MAWHALKRPCHVKRPYAITIRIAPSAPSDAASVEVVRPMMITPSVAKVRTLTGTMPTMHSQITGCQRFGRSSIGTGGPSFGLMKLRPMQ